MKKYIEMIIFIAALGVMAAGVLIGMDLLTGKRIESNKAIEFQQTVLNANGTDYDANTINEIYEELIVIEEKEGFDSNTLTIYTHIETNNVSFSFRGNGLWGDIYGIITLKQDFKTIVDIKVLEQEETPGLGAVVATKDYLANYVGKKFNPTINITNEPVTDSDVDQISGATGTSNAFEKILNDHYSEYYTAYRGGGILPEEERIMREILLLNEYDLDNDNRIIPTIFEAMFKTHTKDDLTMYEYIIDGSLTFAFETANGYGESPILGYLAVEDDFKTIKKIVITEHNENRGKALLAEEQLAKAKGKVFPNIEFVVTEDEGANLTDSQIDGVTGVTLTTTALTNGLNSTYDLYETTFASSGFIIYDTKLKANILLANDIMIKEDMETQFSTNFKTNEENNEIMYENLNNGYNTYEFIGDGVKDDIVGIITLKDDYKTIHHVKVLESDKTEARWGIDNTYFDQYQGKVFDPTISVVESSSNDSEVDQITGATATSEKLQTILNDTYTAYMNSFKGGI